MPSDKLLLMLSALVAVEVSPVFGERGPVLNGAGNTLLHFP